MTTTEQDPRQTIDLLVHAVLSGAILQRLSGLTSRVRNVAAMQGLRDEVVSDLDLVRAFVSSRAFQQVRHLGDYEMPPGHPVDRVMFVRTFEQTIAALEQANVSLQQIEPTLTYLQIADRLQHIRRVFNKEPR